MELLCHFLDVERDTFLTQQKQFQKISEEIGGMEMSIEETRLESVQLESDLSQDPIRNELVPLYSDLMHLTARRQDQDRDERNKLSPEQEREKLVRETKVRFLVKNMNRRYI